MNWWWIVIDVFYIALLVFTSYRILHDTRSSTKSLAYLLTVFFLPVIGIIIYFSFGINYKKRQIYSKKILVSESFQNMVINWTHSRSLQSIEEHQQILDKRVPQFLLSANNSPLTNNNQIDILKNGEEKFECVLREIAKARKSIHIEYYIIEAGNITNKLEKLLIQKVKEGVVVRVIYDDFGSRSIRNKITTRWKEFGIEIHPFYKIKWIPFANRINYRNHRKIIIIDGKIGFVGGINWSDRYSNLETKGVYWRDTHLRLAGPIVANLQAIFLADWNFCTNHPVEPTLDLFEGLNSSVGEKLVQIAAGGPDYAMPTILFSLLQAIHNAKDYIYATTPYYIPDESLQNALCLMAKSGVNVQLLVPEKSDSRWVNAASQSYFKELLGAGVKIYQYQKGFIHAKTLVIDDNLSIVGTANLDYRSFDLNFEVNTVIYNSEIAKELKFHFMEDLKDSKQIHLTDWLNRNKFRVLFEKIAGLLSPLL